MPAPKRPKHPSDNIELRSNYNMSQLDTFRIDSILWRIDNLFMRCGEGRFENLTPYFYAMRSLFHYLRPLMHQGTITEYENSFRILQDMLLTRPKPTVRDCIIMFMRLEAMQNELLRSRQMLGVGFSAFRPSDDRKYLKPEFGGIEDAPSGSAGGT